MGKRPAETESFEGNMSVMQWTRRPSMQRGEPPVMETGLERIAAKARCEPKVRFTSLAHHVTRDRIWGNLCGMPSKTAPGVDGQTVEEAQEEFETWVEPMLRSMHRRGYPAPAVRRVYIPKPGKREKRPIGVPCVADRALQRSVAHVLSAIYEEDFLPCSFGGRPGQGAHHALATLTEVIAGRKVSWVLEADLKNFFGSLNHDWLLRFVEHRVGDPRLLSLMRRWLKAGALEDGVHQPSEEGTPQGGSISVLLSNVYLHYVLDLWFESRGEAPSARRGIYGPLPRRLRGVFSVPSRCITCPGCPAQAVGEVQSDAGTEQNETGRVWPVRRKARTETREKTTGDDLLRRLHPVLHPESGRGIQSGDSD